MIKKFSSQFTLSYFSNSLKLFMYKEVAAKYAGQKDAADKLAQKILKGGSGVWGAVPMPANPQVNEAEAKQLAAWVLSAK